MQNSVSASIAGPDLSRLSERTRGAIDYIACVDGQKSSDLSGTPVRVPNGALLAISGWAADPRSTEPYDDVILMIDGRFAFTADTGFDRTDVRALLGRHIATHSGFRAILPTERLGAGRHHLVVYARTDDGEFHEAASLAFATVPLLFLASPIHRRRSRITVDNIKEYEAHPGAHEGAIPLGRSALFSGWAVDLDTMRAPAGVCAVAEDGSVWTTLCDRRRPDARAALESSDDLIGFELVVPTATLGRGRRHLTLWTYDQVGTRFGTSERATFDVTAEMSAFPGFARRIDAPVRLRVSPRINAFGYAGDLVCTRGDVIAIEGWAACDAIPSPSQVFIELSAEGLVLPPMRYQPLAGYRAHTPRTRHERDDAVPAEATRFRYSLDTSNLAPLDYIVSVAVVAADRCSYARGDACTLRVGAEGTESGTSASARRR